MIWNCADVDLITYLKWTLFDKEGKTSGDSWPCASALFINSTRFMLYEMFQQNASLCLPMPYFECMDNFEVIYFTGTIHYSINLIFMKRALKGGD